MTITPYEIIGAGAFSTHADFNICTYTGAAVGEDDMAGLERLTGIERSRMVFPRQTHSANVAVIDRLPCGELDETDSVVTNLPGVLIGVNTADCAPLLMADVRAGVIAACHCGWRGTVARIAAKTLDAMLALGAHRQDIRAVVGPHICAGCFEVGEEVAGQFPTKAIVRVGGCRPRVDLFKAIALQLPGVEVVDSGLCSKEDERFFSVRRQGYGELRRTLSAIRFA